MQQQIEAINQKQESWEVAVVSGRNNPTVSEMLLLLIWLSSC